MHSLVHAFSIFALIRDYLFLYVDQSLPRLLENFGEDIPTSPEVTEIHTLIFKPNFKFSRLISFGGGPPSPLGGVLGSLGQSLAHVKIWRGSTP